MNHRQPDLALFLPDLCGGGAERVMLNLAIGFARRGLGVDLVVLRATGAYLSQVPPQVRLVDLGRQRLLHSLPALIRYLKRHRPPVLISALEDINIAAIVARWFARVPTTVIVTVHNQLSIEAKHSAQIRRKFVPYLLRWFYSRADGVVAVSRGVAQDLSQISGLALGKIRVIHNPIVTPALLEKIQEPVVHPWLQPGQPPVILAVGRLSPQKDFATLICAFAQVRQRLEARLIILGEGEERQPLEAIVAQLDLAQSVDLPGFVSNPYAYMSRAAVFALSSAWEGFGNVLVEAMAAGTPVVATDCPSGPAEILADGEYGRLTAVGDASGLAIALLHTLNETADSQRLRERSADFAIARILNQYCRIAHLSPIGSESHESGSDLPHEAIAGETS
jgi:glycosyltransferase involved in cell wall biosynthesis